MKTQTILLTLITLAVIISAGFYCWSIYEKQMFYQEKEEAELKQQEQTKIDLNICLLDARLSYNDCWEGHCKILEKEENCDLSFKRADRCKKQRKQDKDYCFKKYPQK